MDSVQGVRRNKTGKAIMEKNRLMWASRRGMLELDLILMPFAEHVYPSLDEVDQQHYWKLLDQEDQDLFAWFLGRLQPDDPDLLRIVQLVNANSGVNGDGK